MLKVLILLSVAAVALGGVTKTLTPLDKYPTGGKIVGGEPVGAGENPWQVSIQRTSNSQYCGASIISPNWIVTAAHCSDINPSNFQIRAGTLTYASGGSVHSITQVIPHENYNSRTFENDIAVWEVSPAFNFGSSVGAINLLAQGTNTPDGTMTWVSGWGTTSSGGSISSILLKVDVPIVNYNSCDNDYNGGVPPNQICAGYPQGGKDSCQGDSGGPLYLDAGDQLVGIVSWGNGCALPGYPGVYTEAAAYRDWIRTNTGV